MYFHVLVECVYRSYQLKGRWLYSRSLSLWHSQVCNIAGDDCSKQHIKYERGVLPLGVPHHHIFHQNCVITEMLCLWWFSDLQREWCWWYTHNCNNISANVCSKAEGELLSYGMMFAGWWFCRKAFELPQRLSLVAKFWADFVRRRRPSLKRRIQIKFSFIVLSVQLNRFVFQLWMPRSQNRNGSEYEAHIPFLVLK